jgi:hypothetical protein
MPALLVYGFLNFDRKLMLRELRRGFGPAYVLTFLVAVIGALVGVLIDGGIRGYIH